MCSAKNDGLVRYPTVLAPAVRGVITVTVQCADNANNATFFMIVWCDILGGWQRIFSKPVPRCQCNSGYRIATVESREICQGLSTLEVISSPNVSF